MTRLTILRFILCYCTVIDGVTHCPELITGIPVGLLTKYSFDMIGSNQQIKNCLCELNAQMEQIENNDPTTALVIENLMQIGKQTNQAIMLNGKK